MMELARFIGEEAIRERQDDTDPMPTVAQERASKGGQARAKKLTRAKRVAIAQKGVKARKKRR